MDEIAQGIAHSAAEFFYPAAGEVAVNPAAGSVFVIPDLPDGGLPVFHHGRIGAVQHTDFDPAAAGNVGHIGIEKADAQLVFQEGIDAIQQAPAVAAEDQVFSVVAVEIALFGQGGDAISIRSGALAEAHQDVPAFGFLFVIDDLKGAACHLAQEPGKLLGGIAGNGITVPGGDDAAHGGMVDG